MNICLYHILRKSNEFPCQKTDVCNIIFSIVSPCNMYSLLLHVSPFPNVLDNAIDIRAAIHDSFINFDVIIVVEMRSTNTIT